MNKKTKKNVALGMHDSWLFRKRMELNYLIKNIMKVYLKKQIIFAYDLSLLACKVHGQLSLKILLFWFCAKSSKLPQMFFYTIK